jgi:DNA-binding transcriptional LysR family regulator
VARLRRRIVNTCNPGSSGTSWIGTPLRSHAQRAFSEKCESANTYSFGVSLTVVPHSRVLSAAPGAQRVAPAPRIREVNPAHVGYVLDEVLVDWSALRDFLLLAELGSISRAAQRLEVSQPALSRRLQRLEEELGVGLFLRGPRGLQLTAAGQRVRTIAERMSGLAGEVAEAVRHGHDPVSGVVRISAPEAGLGTDWLPRVLVPLRRQHPELALAISIDNQVVDLARGAADIALRLLRPSDPALTARRVAKISWGMFAARQYLERRPGLASVGELAGHDLLLYEQSLQTRQRSWLERNGLVARVALISNNIDALVRATRAGWGVALLPLAAVAADLAASDVQLRRVLPGLELVSHQLWLVTSAELRKSPRIRTVFQFLTRCFERDRELFAAGALHDRQ